MQTQVKALEAAEAARRKDAAKAADRVKQKDTIEQQKADRARHAMEVKVLAHAMVDWLPQQCVVLPSYA